MTAVAIRPLGPADHEAWRPLWLEYLGYHGMWPEDAPADTWDRLMQDTVAMHGLGAFAGERLVGIAHYLLHPHPWWTKPVCLLSDVFTAWDVRRSGVARALVEAVFARAAVLGAEHVYGTTLVTNTVSQGLYDQVAVRMPLMVYRHQL